MYVNTFRISSLIWVCSLLCHAVAPIRSTIGARLALISARNLTSNKLSRFWESCSACSNRRSCHGPKPKRSRSLFRLFLPPYGNVHSKGSSTDQKPGVYAANPNTKRRDLRHIYL